MFERHKSFFRNVTFLYKLKNATSKAIFRVHQFDKATLLAAGPMTKQPSTIAYRIVMVAEWSNCHKMGRIVVWNQGFNDWPDLENTHFYSGDYYRLDQLAEATARFAKRIADSAESIKSIYEEPTMKLVV